MSELPGAMRAAVFRGAAGHEVQERPVPVPGPGEVLVRVAYAGICGSDLHATDPALAGTPGYPSGQVLGHEISGRVVRRGVAVTQFDVGDRVTSMAITGCGHCAHCLGGDIRWCAAKQALAGGYAEYACTSAASCAALPDEVDDLSGALVEPVASGAHAARLAAIAPGARVLVIGAGTVGLAACWFARRRGAGRVVLASRSARPGPQLAAAGVDSFLTVTGDLPDACAAALDGPPSVVFEATGAAGMIRRAVDCLAPRGELVVPGVCYQRDEIEPMTAIMKEARIQFSRGYDAADIGFVLAGLAARELDAHRLVAGVAGLSSFPDAFEEARRGGQGGKILLDPRI